MSTTVKTGWLNDKNGDKFAPKTLTSQVQTSDGTLFEDKLQTDLDTTLATAQAYTDTKTAELASTTEMTNSISAHNTSADAHNDIRDLITGLTTRLNTLADSDDTTLDQMSEIVAYIKSNKSLIDSITTNKVNVSDIINNRQEGYNALTGTYGNMFEMGLIDPCLCMKTALTNATSVASLIITTETAVVEKQKDTPNPLGGLGTDPRMAFV